MTTHQKIASILGIIAATVAFPMAGALIYNHGALPADFFTFPATSFSPKPGFNIWVFIAIAAAALFFVVLYLFPRWFGFRTFSVEKNSNPAKRPAPPIWFWVGIVLHVATLVILWGKFSEPKIILNWAVVPLFWGFALVLDGIVYMRTRGHSLINDKPQTIIGIGVCSVGAWLIFEYLNFFIGDNWIYPKGTLISSTEFYLYALVGSAGLMPMTIEWYSLFTTFRKFELRYSSGPAMTLPTWAKVALLVLCFAAMFLLSFFPDQLFFLIWLGPMFILALWLSIIEIWTPLTPVRQGNWTAMAFICLAEMVQGTLCEFWNYFSAYHDGPLAGCSNNPDYWQYSIPYVNVFHVFEMPVLGLFGYLPFGAFCWISWIVFCYLLNIPSSIEIKR